VGAVTARQVRAEVVALRPAGAYHALKLRAPGVAGYVRPGQFVALAVGGEHTSMLLRRSFSVYRAEAPGAGEGTVEVVFAVHGKGTAWLARRRPGDVVDLAGPLGRPFTVPREKVACTLVGGGYGSAPLFGLAEKLTARGCRVDMVLGAASADRLFGAWQAAEVATSVTLTTEDGSAGEAGRVTDVLGRLVRGTGAGVVYACGPMGMLRAVSRIASACGAYSQCAVEESMACGIGVCMTCVLPVRGEDGVTRMVRSCVDGPVFPGEAVRWDAVGTIPEGTWGEPVPGGHR
jgi:dihydroorotate dehydrogenase electron transfer subunit